MRRRWLSALLAAVLAGACGACARRSADPALAALSAALAPGERVLLLRALGSGPGADPADRIAAIVRPAGGREELRVYERRGGALALVHTERQGDLFRNLVVEDVDGDHHPDLVVTWEGGQLEILEVIVRGEDGVYRTLFQNAGQEIERRYGPGGAVEFWITSRTYEEGPGAPPIYASTPYRWDGKAFSEIKR